jgi:hypothetical protein
MRLDSAVLQSPSRKVCLARLDFMRKLLQDILTCTCALVFLRYGLDLTDLTHLYTTLRL